MVQTENGRGNAHHHVDWRVRYGNGGTVGDEAHRLEREREGGVESNAKALCVLW